MNIHNLELLKTLDSTISAPSLSANTDSATAKLQSSHFDSFSNVLNDSLTKLEGKQLASDYAIQGLVTGEADALHQVMIQTTEAQVALELAVQLRNRSVEAMNEIKNMQF